MPKNFILSERGPERPTTHAMKERHAGIMAVGRRLKETI